MSAQTIASATTTHRSRALRTDGATKTRITRGRTLHLIDIENLVAGRATEANLAAAWDAYQNVVRIHPGDQVRVSCRAFSAAKVAFSIPTSRQLLIGASHVLRDSVDVAEVAVRFDNVVIASGAKAFAPVAVELANAGCPVTVAHRGTWCPATLRLASTAQHSLIFPIER